MADFRLQIVTAQKTVFDGNVTSLILPGEYDVGELAPGEKPPKLEPSYFGILANHAPIVAVLQAGKVTIRRGSREYVTTISGGFVEMSNNVATLLVDSIDGLDAMTSTAA